MVATSKNAGAKQTAQVKPTNRQPLVEPLTRSSEHDVFDQHLAKRFRHGPQATRSLAFLEIDDFQILKDTYG
ncbi:MAG: hypothetical protein VYA84_02410, partial [Planctomycetota bacterium]|nr:hypothetical protein [Planctomycetota bacterium]